MRPVNAHDRQRVNRWLLFAVAYTVLAIACTWPVASHISSGLPHDANDPAFNTWILSWNARAVPATTRWWNAPFFWPMPGALALSEHLVGVSLFTTPLQWMGATPLAAYNLAFLVSFPLSALGAHALAFAIAKRHDAAVIAGLAFGFNPYRFSQVPHLQVLWAFGIPVALMALHRYHDTGKPRWLAVFGVAWAFEALSNGYFLLLLPILIGFWLIWYARDARRAASIVATWAVASLPLLPFLEGYRSYQGAFGLSRRADEVERFSADLSALMAAAPFMRVWGALARFARPEGELFPGMVVLSLAVAGATAALWRARADAGWGPRWAVGLRRAFSWLGVAAASVALSQLATGPWKLALAGRTLISVSSPEKPFSLAVFSCVAAGLLSSRFRRVWRAGSAFAFYSLGALAMFVFALGPRARAAGHSVLYRAPYSWVMGLPGFSGIRVPARFGTLFVLCLSVAAAIAFARFTSRTPARVRVWLTALAACAIAIESWPRIALAEPSPPFPSAWTAGSSATVVELPLGITERDINALYRAIFHHRPLANGYSGYEPRHYSLLKLALEAGDEGALDALARDGDLLVVVDHREQFDRWSSFVERHPRHLFAADDGVWRLYRIAAAPPPPANAVDGPDLPIASVTANLMTNDAPRAIDRDMRTVWNSGRAQAGDEAFTIDLGQPREVTAVKLRLGLFVFDYPRRLAIDCSLEPDAWRPCWQGSAGAAAVGGALDSPREAAMTLYIDHVGARWIRLRQTGADRVNGWSIAELGVVGR